MLDGVGIAMEKGLYDLNIDSELEHLLPPLATEVFNGLTDSLIKDGCIEPLVVSNGTIVDGHNRYRICRENNIPFEYIEKEFADKDDIKLWMFRKQSYRRSIPVFQRCELVYHLKEAILKEVEQERRKAISIYRQTGTHGSRSHQKTADRLAENAIVSPTMWKRANFIIENADESLKEQVRAEKLSIRKAYDMLKAKNLDVSSKEITIEDEDYDENEDQRLHEMIRAMPKENTTDPRADAVIKDEGEIPVKKIGGYEPAVYQEAPILMSSEEPQRIPGDFYYVEEQTKYSMRTMLDNLKIGLYWLKDEDCNRRDEILSIVEEGFSEAKKLIEQETRR